MQGRQDTTRRRLCSSLGAHAVQNTPKLHTDKWLHSKGVPPPSPTIPCGNLWELLNQIKILHQYTELVAEAAKGQGPHAFALYGGSEACVDGLEWMAPLCLSVEQPLSPEDYNDHMTIWRANNPGDFRGCIPCSPELRCRGSPHDASSSVTAQTRRKGIRQSHCG